MPSFDDVASLESWLRAKGIAADLFGKGTAKSLPELLEECQSGECELNVDASGKPLRHVTVLSVWVCDDSGRVLVEVGQQLPSGQRRERRLPLSEKMLPSEHWRDATLRGIREELGSALAPGAKIEIDEGSHEVTTASMVSGSYPDLTTRYTSHKVRARVACLPDHGFSTTERRPEGILTATWDWVPAEVLSAK